MYRVLIVDDETTIREQLPVSFEWAQYGFQVVDTAPNGRVAMEKTESLRPDLILLDIRMPVMDGLSFLKWLHDSPFRETQVILLTGYSEFDYAITAMRYGARGYLTKPLDEDEISDYLTEIAAELAAREKEETGDICPDLAESAKQYMESHYMEPDVTVNSIAATLYVTPAHLGQVFRKTAGITIRQYLKSLRIRRAKELLEHTGLHVYEIAHRVGFQESKYFVVCFQEEVGLSPAAYRRERTGREEE